MSNYQLYSSLQDCNVNNPDPNMKCVLTQAPYVPELMQYQNTIKPLLERGYVRVEDSFCKVSDLTNGTQQINCVQVPTPQIAYQAYSIQSQTTSPL